MGRFDVNMVSELKRALAVFILTLGAIGLEVYRGVLTMDGGLHLIGIVGTLYMLLSQVYTLRKRTRILNFWKLKSVLGQHTLLGIAGPLLIIGHTELRFRGIAGVSAIFMLAVFTSGFIGRYIYRRVPTNEKKKELQQAKKEFEKDLGQSLDVAGKERVELERQIAKLERELAYYSKMKGLLSNWRSVHWPLTVTFFVTVGLHVFSIYYFRGGL